MEATVRYKALYVVSDLHLGGKAPHQIFSQGPELAALIDHVQTTLPGESVALVLNGDILDYLAEPSAEYFDPKNAVTKLERIMADGAFSMVFAALGRLVKTESRELVLVLGNHDVELALPDVRERILQELCGASAAARGRVRFALEGAGFACSVGGRTVLCVHGNEVDPFNVVDFRQLLEMQRAHNRGQAYPEWTPNAGTKLVIDVMNAIKEDYPFVDLLKPETKPVPAVIFALDKQAAARILALGPVVSRLAKDSIRISAGLLGTSTEEGIDSASQAAALEELLGVPLAGAADRKTDVAGLLERVELDIQSGTETPVARADGGELLGTWGLVVDRLLKRDPKANLLEALQRWLGQDTTFQADCEDPPFLKLDQLVSPKVDFLVAGHTHLERSLKRRNGRGMYFNSGTWIRLIRLTQAMLANAESFDPVYKVLKAGSMQALDEAKPFGQPLVVLRPTVVEIKETDTGAQGRLARVRIGPPTQLETVASSERSV